MGDQIKDTLDVMYDQAIQGMAELRLCCSRVVRGTWWAKYTEHVGHGPVKARARKIMRQGLVRR